MSWFQIAITVSLVGGPVAVAAGAWARRRSPEWRKVIVDALLWVWAWGVLAMTFGTQSGGGSALNLNPLDVTNAADVVDFGLNALMFAPAGILLAIRPTRAMTALLIGLGSSSCIEALQFILATGRTADVNDLLANTLGCLIGFAVTATIIGAVARLRSRSAAESE